MNKSFVFTFIFVITGAIVGAGFASGKEIASFFAQYGFWSIPFILLAGILFFFVFCLFAKIGKNTKPNSISDLTKTIFGKSSIVVDFAFIISSFITLSSMIAGLDSTMHVAVGENYVFPFVSIVCCIIVAVILNFGLKKILKFTDNIMPFLFAMIIAISLAFLLFGKREQIGYASVNRNVFSMSISPFLYVSMNVFGNIFLIAKVSTYLKKRQIVVASVISSVLLIISILLVALCVLFGGEKVFYSDMPMLSLATSLGQVFEILYFVILIVAIFTTICTTAYTISKWLNNYISNSFLCGVIVLTMGFVFSRFGFSTIVDIFYPIEGIFGSIFIIISALFYFKNLKNKKNVNEKTPIVDGVSVSKKNGQIVIKKKYRKKK